MDHVGGYRPDLRCHQPDQAVMRSGIFYLDNRGLHAYQYRKGDWLLSGCFSNTTEGHREFSAWLRARPLDAYQLLANLPHEQILQANIPLVRGNDREVLIRRRLEQHFPGNTLRMAESAGQASGKENLLLSAFNSSSAFTPWILEMAREHVRLQGIYSASQLCSYLLKQLSTTSTTHCLLYVLDDGNLHQYFLRSQQTYLHRVLALPSENPEWLVQESNKLQQYLLTQQLIPYSEPLHYFLLGTLPEHFLKPKGNIFELTAPKAIPQLFLDALRAHRPKNNFAEKEQVVAGKLALNRLQLSVICSVTCFFSLAGAAYFSLENGRLEEETMALVSAARQLEQQATPTSETAALPALRQLTSRHLALQRMQKLPQADLAWLSRTLDKNTDIHLDKIDWHNDSGRIRLRIEAHADANLDNPQQKISAFISSLMADRHQRVRREPLNLSASGSLRGSANQQPQSSDYRFILHVGEQP